MKSPTASNWTSPKSNSRTPRKSNKAKAGSKRTGPATRTSTTTGKSDTIGLWNRRDPSQRQKEGLPPLLLDHIPNLRRDIRPAELGDGADAGRRGHVDLGETAVDDVDADEQQSALAQRRAQG